MSAIIGFISTMLPYMAIAAPIYIIARIIYLKCRKRTFAPYRETALLLFVLFAAGLASLTVAPEFVSGISGFAIVKNGIHATNLIPFKVLFETYNEVFNKGNINYFLINFLGNIVMFMPFGFFIPLLWKLSDRAVILIGFCSSLFVEICQLFLARGTDIDDLMLNTLGVIAGLLIYKLLRRKNPALADRFRI